ncbi:hypothetical protein [Mycolicibacterium rutilum]|nr:hypothetical protein [Mycolicibacterium rutilum]
MTTSNERPIRTPRRVPHTRSYGLLLRLADRTAGRTDRRTLSTAAPGSGTALMSRLQATFDENDRSLVVRLREVCEPSARRLRELLDEADRLSAVIDRQRSALAATTPPTAADLAHRNGGELHLDAEAVSTRRLREHRARVDATNAALESAQRQRNAVLVESVRHTARLVEQFELACTVSEQLRHHYNRRLATYARAARLAPGATPSITVPEWTTRPCPWLPHNAQVSK